MRSVDPGYVISTILKHDSKVTSYRIARPRSWHTVERALQVARLKFDFREF